MSLELAVLRALLRLARRRTPATAAEILARVDASEEEIDRVVVRLLRADLAYRVEGGVRLSLGGLAVAAASVPPVGRRARRAPKPVPATRAPAHAAQVVPMARRRSAA